MKPKILYFLSVAIFFCAASGTLKAQSQEQIEKFKEEQRIYYTEKLELTEAEGKAFWPIYDDFLNRKMKLVEDERNTWSYAHKNADNLSDKEILETLEKGQNLKQQQLNLEIEYYRGKFLEALPAKKVLKLGKVEWDFRRHLLRKLRKDGKGGRGQGERGQGGSAKGSDGGEPSPMGPSPLLY
jgi:hypothetical protein